ncbi:MAG: glycosyltransferase family 39 protein, partial [Pseudomonadota bacterium]|nr:glycosyltransferase family 39 protein [Pseudomonadota bacterium]
MPTHRLDTLKDVLLIIAVWWGGVVLVNPVGEFPLFDDWAFSRTVEHLLNTGEYDPLNWGWMTLVTNALWGALFCLPQGFSFTALRISTLVAATLGLVGVYILFRDLQQPRSIVAIAVALTGFNPYFFSLSHSFMTEALFTALLVWTSILLLRALRTGSYVHLAIGAVLGLAATLSRQLAVCVPLAFAVVQLLRSNFSPPSVIRALTPLVVCLAGYLSVLWIGVIGVNVNALIFNSLGDVGKVFRTIIDNSYIALVHSGLLLFPLLLLEIVHLQRRPPAQVITAGAIALLVVTLTVVAKATLGGQSQQILLPLSSWLVKSGVGPAWLYDMVFLQNDNMQPLPAEFWIAVTAIALTGAVILIMAFSLRIGDVIGRRLRNGAIDDADLVTTFAFLTVIIYFLLLLTAPFTWDRYVVPMVPFMAVTIIGPSSSPTSAWNRVWPPGRIAAWTLLALFGAYAVAGTRDYLAWNRVRWTALHALMQED